MCVIVPWMSCICSLQTHFKQVFLCCNVQLTSKGFPGHIHNDEICPHDLCWCLSLWTKTSEKKYIAYEQAGMMLKDMKRMPEAIQLIEKACVMYVENGTAGTAGIALDRAGKLMEPMDLEKAVDLYQKAAYVFETEDRLTQAAEMLGKASRLLVRLRKLDDAAASLQKEKTMYKDLENYPTCFKKTTAQVLIHLHRGDFVAADKCVRESYSFPGYNNSEDCVAMETLLQGYDEQDEDQVHRVCNSPLLKYMDNDYAKLAISLRVPGGGGGKKKKTPAAPQGGAGGPAAAAADDDDYEEGGLC
ncbi:N-ethylmaleimide-sensitive factor attachment protein, gamma b isoform X2 [Alosa sapidissima]|uniref:N-ethylmaleimide-sensitive factor attachment protein, gamma b isoform X2 n=1 Tax=Alosa sapidissima TaxID=34773 RepID=UPI001C09BEF7|nr:N-ethylmaleimide-sensitive factor attachment protein, gamma b isoform X2 [Alosa sapidissima]